MRRLSPFQHSRDGILYPLATVSMCLTAMSANEETTLLAHGETLREKTMLAHEETSLLVHGETGDSSWGDHVSTSGDRVPWSDTQTMG
jgi:hypothetical protein